MLNDHNKKSAHNIIIFSAIWIVAIGILMFSLYQNLGYAKVINYSGVVRGATQRLIKKELTNHPDDDMIVYLDELLENLHTGHGSFNLIKIDDENYQNQIQSMMVKWEEIKTEINHIRAGQSPDRLFSLSENYFEDADRMVHTAEEYSNLQLKQLIVFFLFYLVLSISAFIIWYRFKQDELNKVLYIDSLSGIPNLTAFELNVAAYLEKKHDKELVVLCFDINDFKFLNTSYGYPLGDSLIKIIAKVVKKVAVQRDCCARSGADNFYLLAENRKDLYVHIGTHVIEAIQKECAFDIASDISFSFGGFKIHGDIEIREIIDRVNLAHKNAKSMKSDAIIWYDHTLTVQLLEDNKKIKQMHRDLQEEKFLLYLQPKFDVATLEIIGAEALVRWQFSKEVFLYPDSFIPLFELTGNIFELDFYMLEKTCAYIKTHHLEQSHFKVSINFSRVTLYRKNFREQLFIVLDKYDVSPTSLEIEITENSINGLSDPIIYLLQDLRQQGFLISIDDFGTGYSSLSLLSSLPVDILKIDKAFLLDKHNEKNIQDILGLIISVAHSLNIKVICEGVETQEQVNLLKTLSCDYGQGYLISKPIDENDFESKYLARKECAVR